MRRLIHLEARRFAARRLTRGLAALVLLGFLFAGGLVFAKSHRDVAKATATARAGTQSEYETCRVESGIRADLCERPDLDQVTAEPRFRLVGLVEITEGIAALLTILALAAGASFVGADWSHRVMATMLTWETRRVRFAIAKATAAAAVTFVAAVMLQVVLVAALTPAAVWRGTTGGVSGPWFADLAGSIVRGGVVAAAGAAIGVALALIGRASAAAIGVAFVWVAVAENSIRAGAPGMRRWLVSDSAGAFVTGGSPEFVRAPLTAGLLLGCYTVFAVVVASQIFSRRDVA
jgi:ABC-type transport system involved in multi-copper enzyme maturation permease subunit